MIIDNLKAYNVLKYAHLELRNMPDKGQIAISGPNESGKTGIVETLCFALFGRTFSHDSAHITKIIRWGEVNCRVELEFTGSDKKDYKIVRSLNSDGVHAAELYHLTENAPFAIGPATVHDAVVEICGFDYREYVDTIYLAQLEISAPHSQSDTIKAIAGTADLEQAIIELRDEMEDEKQQVTDMEADIQNIRKKIDTLGINEYDSSNIEAQKSSSQQYIGNIEKKVATLKDGAATLQAAGDQAHATASDFIKADNKASLSTWSYYLEQFKECVRVFLKGCKLFPEHSKNELCNDNQFTQLVNDLQHRLFAFEKVRNEIKSYRDLLAYQLGELVEHTEIDIDEPTLPKQIAQARTGLIKSRLHLAFSEAGFIISSLVALSMWIWWWLLRPPTGSDGPGTMSTWLDNNVTWWDPGYLTGILPSAFIFTIGAFIALMVAKRLEAEAKRRREQFEAINDRLADTRSLADFLSSIDSIPFTEAAAGLRELDDELITQVLEAFVHGEGDLFFDHTALSQYQEKISATVSYLNKQVSEVRAAIAAETGRLSRIIEEQKGRIKDLDQEVSLMEEKRDQVKSFARSIEEIRQKKLNCEQAIRSRKLAIKLLTNTCKNVYNRFNSILNRTTSEVIPQLTESRYKQMRIDDSFNVKIFTSEKNDFAELDELSSGTQRQLLLAVRLAMAKALVNAAQLGEQFIILDEPFAFFDKDRIRSTLKALPYVDQQIKQIWIISQEFGTLDEFKLRINCTRNSDVLIFGQSPTIDSKEQSAALN